ncbi:MAG: hypothetical protein ACLUKN_11220 [Bacilli bacterium]
MPVGFSGVDMAGFEDCSGDAESVGSPDNIYVGGFGDERNFYIGKISINFCLHPISTSFRLNQRRRLLQIFCQACDRFLGALTCAFGLVITAFKTGVSFPRTS